MSNRGHAATVRTGVKRCDLAVGYKAAKNRSVETGDVSTVASTRGNNSFVGSPGGWNYASTQREGAPTDLTDVGDMREIREKVRRQEQRLSAFLGRVREKEAEAAEANTRCRELAIGLRDSQTQVGLLKEVVADYERQVQSLVAKTNASLERIVHQKNAEIERLKTCLSLFEDQYAAKLEAEVLSQSMKSNSNLDRFRELAAANEKIAVLTAKNEELFAEIMSYQRQLSELKSQQSDIRRPLQSHFHEIESLQSAIVAENQLLTQEVASLTQKESENVEKLSLICSELFKHRCSLTLFSRVLTAIHDGETFNLSLLLRSKCEAERTQGCSLDTCLMEARLILASFETLESQAVEWYSEHFEETCRVS